MAKTRFRADVAYDGTAYHGWQCQPNISTVQGCLEAALRQVTGADIRIHSSGRTDTGVHARAQVFHFDVPAHARSGITAHNLECGMNAIIPKDIRVKDVCRVDADFHARFSTVGKEYRYFIWNGQNVPPFLRLYRLRIVKKLDIEAMRQAAAVLVGEHDFAAFTVNPHRDLQTTVRHLRMLDIKKRDDEVEIITQANGYLYKMVRSIVGCLVRVGMGDMTVDAVRERLESKVRTAHVPTAMPMGLFLWRVDYEHRISDENA